MSLKLGTREQEMNHVQAHTHLSWGSIWRLHLHTNCIKQWRLICKLLGHNYADTFASAGVVDITLCGAEEMEKRYILASGQLCSITGWVAVPVKRTLTIKKYSMASKSQFSYTACSFKKFEGGN